MSPAKNLNPLVRAALALAAGVIAAKLTAPTPNADAAGGRGLQVVSALAAASAVWLAAPTIITGKPL